jgi:aerobic-type carbon monoxide dehydrogenase small subunit (CoxS/CutS family)
MVKHNIKLKIRYYFVLGQSQKSMGDVQKAWLLKFVYECTNCDTAMEGIEYKMVTLVDEVWFEKGDEEGV